MGGLEPTQQQAAVITSYSIHYTKLYEMVKIMMKQNLDVSYTEIDCPFGHDSFLLETSRQSVIISSFLETVYARTI